MRRLGSGALLTLRHSQGTVVLECSEWYTAELRAKGHEWRLCQVRIVDASKVDSLRLPEAPRTSSFLQQVPQVVRTLWRCSSRHMLFG